MQVSIYLNESLVKKIDQKIKRGKLSRSQYIQQILQNEFFPYKKKKNAFAEVAGILSPKEAGKMLRIIYSSRKSKKSIPSL